MSTLDLPATPTINPAFKEKGRTDVIMCDVFPVKDGERLKLIFESCNSPWRQGVWLKTDKFLKVNQQEYPSVQLWEDSAPTGVTIECHTQNGLLHLYNIWNRGKGSESQAWTSGMVREELSNGRRYRCNDIGFASDFAKLVFRIERYGARVKGTYLFINGVMKSYVPFTRNQEQ